MEKFSIDIVKGNNSAEELKVLEGDIKRFADDVNSIKNSVRISDSADAQIKNNLNRLNERIINLALRMDSLSEAVKTIVRLYGTCEDRLSGEDAKNKAKQTQEFSSTSREEAQEKGKDKRKWYQKFWDWITRNEVDTDFTHTTKKQEQEADRAMQRKIENITKKERYSKETWEKATLEEREKILTEYMHEVAGVLGVNVNPEINFFDEPRNSEGLYKNGSYNSTYNCVNMNINEGLSYSKMTTIVHELRHAYQWDAIKHPTKHQVSKETIDSWKHSFDTYAEEQAKGYEAYRNIIIEKDARAFAGQS